MKDCQRSILWLTAALVLATTIPPAHADDGVSVWINRYNGRGNSDDQSKAVAADDKGNVFVTGSSDNVYVTLAYSPMGIPLWTNRYTGRGSSFANALAVDDHGNVFVTGSSHHFSTAPFRSDFATVAYSNTGVPLWTNRFHGPGPGDDRARAMAADRNGNLFVTGSSHNFDAFPNSVGYATIAYSSAGVPLWTNYYTGSGIGMDYPAAIAVDNQGNVFVTGYSYRFGDGNSSYEYATVAYSNSGVPLWTNQYNAPTYGNARASGVAVDDQGKVFVTGSSVVSNLSFDYATIAYSAAGVALWTNLYVGPGMQDDVAQAIAVDRHGNVLVTGYSAGSNSQPYNYDYATVAYSNNGVPLWTNRYGGSANDDDSPAALTVDSVGNVFITGSSIGIPGQAGFSDYATVAYSNTGIPLWTNRYGSPQNYYNQANAITVDRRGNVSVTGFSNGSNSYDYLTIQYASSDHPPVADASATASLVISPDGVVAAVTLDASRSSDPDGDSLQYLWCAPPAPSPLASGVVAVTVLTVGMHSLSLEVDDGMLSATNAFTVEVVTSAEAIRRLTAAVVSAVKGAQSLVATLTAALASIDRGNPVSALNQLQAFQNKVRAQVAPVNNSLAETLIWQAQQVIDVLTGGNTNPGGRQHGRFTSVFRQANGPMTLQFTAELGQNYTLEASTNLVEWEMISVARGQSNGVFIFEDADAAKFPTRFYRAVHSTH